MELITPSVEIWEQGNTLAGIWSHIARCVRVCYQSTPKENGETDEDFVKRVILRPNSSTGEFNFDKTHGAMLEHGTVYLKVCHKDATESLLYTDYLNNYYSRIFHRQEDDCFYITTNLRVIYENNWLDDLKYICTPTEYHARRVTVSFITNIGVSREFNRHRVNSITEESTRYCNYTKQKFNGNVQYALPAWILSNDNHKKYVENQHHVALSSYLDDILWKSDEELDEQWNAIDFYLAALKFCEWSYNRLIAHGWTAQMAREVLPLATKSQLIHTAFVSDWEHFIELRANGVSGAPHPNAKLIANTLKSKLYEKFI